MKTLNRDMFYRDFRKVLRERFPKEKAELIWHQAQQEYEKIIRSEPNLLKHKGKMVLPAVALYRVLNRNHEDGEGLLNAYGDEKGKFFADIAGVISGIPGMTAWIRNHIEMIMDRMSSEKLGYRRRVVSEPPEMYGVDILNCPYHDLARQMGEEKAVRCICYMDLAYMKGFRNFRYERTKAVSEGDDCCDYRLRFNTAEKMKMNGNGWDGILLPYGNRKDKIMIVVSGSDGGISFARKTASYLCDHGIPAFALGYFITKHSGKALDRIPVEIVGDVIGELKKLGYEKIGIEGISKGTELAMAAAIRYPEISCVILKTPSWYYSEGVKNKQPAGYSCWTYEGKEIPYTPYAVRKFSLPKQILKYHEFNILAFNTGKKIVPESIIPAEKINGPVLMFSVKRDTVWPSEESSEKLCARFEENAFPWPYKHISFGNMSHMMIEDCRSRIRYIFRSERENPSACSLERQEMGKECIRWIEDVWKEG